VSSFTKPSSHPTPSGKKVPRAQRATSGRVASQSRLKSRGGFLQVSKPSAVSVEEVALQPSEPNTDVESVADIPPSAPATRRRAREIQSRLGKGRPVLAGGRGARNVSKVNRGIGRKSKSGAMLRDRTIPEEGMMVARSTSTYSDTFLMK
jgi:hypothetical protein